MTVFLDTNYLIRFLTGDIKKQAEKAKKIIKATPNIFLTEIVIAETVYILEKHYRTQKRQLCKVLTDLLLQPNIASPRYCIQALKIYQKHAISFYDCLLLAEVLDHNATLKTFDQKLNRVYQKQVKKV